jgi:hypothetical protein
MRALKAIIARNPKVDAEQLRESLELTRKLAKSGIKPKGYRISSPYRKRLIKASIAELATGKD